MPNTITDARERSKLSWRILLLTHQAERQWGTMTAGQMLCHLADGMEQAMGRKPDSDQSNILLRTAVKALILRVLPKMPRALPTPKGMNQNENGTPPTDFDSDRNRVLVLLEESGSWPPEKPMDRHPLLGPLSHTERAILTWKHLDHHLRQFGV